MSEEPGGREVRREIYIEASPKTVFALLTDATEMKKWQAEIVDADPVPGGIFRLGESGGMQIEGHYVEVVPYSKVVFTWGGIGGVAPGQSTVEFLLEPSGTGTLVRLRHYSLPASSFERARSGMGVWWLAEAQGRRRRARSGRALPRQSGTIGVFAREGASPATECFARSAPLRFFGNSSRPQTIDDLIQGWEEAHGAYGLNQYVHALRRARGWSY